MINALTVDLEEYFQVSNFDRVVLREQWDSLPSRLREQTTRLLDLFEASEHRATFFVLGWVAERHAALLREIRTRGHEVACHGYSHELVYQLGPERFRKDLRRARAALEDACGAAVDAYRAPSYSITRDSLWALRILVEEGFTLDSSIFPIRHPRYGIPGFFREPVHLDLGDGLYLSEFPLTTLRLGPVLLPLAGGAYLRFLPAPLFRWGFQRLVQARQATVLYLHPWEIDPTQPRQKVGWRIRINHYYNLSRTEERLRWLLTHFPFSPLGESLRTLKETGQLPIRRLEELA